MIELDIVQQMKFCVVISMFGYVEISDFTDFQNLVVFHAQTCSSNERMIQNKT